MLAISWEFSCCSYIWPLHWFRLLMAWQLDSERKHPKNGRVKSLRQKLQGSLRPSLRSPRTSALPHSRGLADCYGQSTFEERGRAACSYTEGRDWWQPPWGPPTCRSSLAAERSWGLKQWSSVFPVQTNRSWVSCLVNYERKPSLYWRGRFTKKVIQGPSLRPALIEFWLLLGNGECSRWQGGARLQSGIFCKQYSIRKDLNF